MPVQLIEENRFNDEDGSLIVTPAHFVVTLEDGSSAGRVYIKPGQTAEDIINKINFRLSLPIPEPEVPHLPDIAIIAEVDNNFNGEN